MRSADCTSASVAVGFPWRQTAATPIVCGIAIDVLLIVFVAVSEELHADVTLTSGANQSTQLPTFAMTPSGPTSRSR